MLAAGAGSSKGLGANVAILLLKESGSVFLYMYIYINILTPVLTSIAKPSSLIFVLVRGASPKHRPWTCLAP